MREHIGPIRVKWLLKAYDQGIGEDVESTTLVGTRRCGVARVPKPESKHAAVASA